MPNDIRNPFPTERIRPATNIRKNDFIGLKIYESNQKKYVYFFIQNHYSASLWVIQKNIVDVEKLVHVSVELKEELKRNNYFLIN